MEHLQSPSQSDRFQLSPARDYRAWRASKLRSVDRSPSLRPIEIRDPRRLSTAESSRLRRQLANTNLALYGCDKPVDGEALRSIGRQLGLVRLDHHLCADPSGVATITDGGDAGDGEFIPYTNRALNWHTDGYYRPPPLCVRAFLLHCVAAARQGGANRFFDHELAYILLRDREPHWITALSAPDVLLIPGYDRIAGGSRPDVAGPVFSVDQAGRLHMRYTARTRNVIWKADNAVRDAIAFLHEMLDDAQGYRRRYTLRPGEGIVCANVLHSREAYNDENSRQGRTLLRARYLDPLVIH